MTFYLYIMYKIKQCTLFTFTDFYFDVIVFNQKFFNTAQ